MGGGKEKGDVHILNPRNHNNVIGCALNRQLSCPGWLDVSIASYLPSFLSVLSSLVSFPFLPLRFFYLKFAIVPYSTVVVVVVVIKSLRADRLMTAEGTIRGASVNHEEPRAAREGGERVSVAESRVVVDRGRSGTGGCGSFRHQCGLCDRLGLDVLFPFW